MNTHDIELPPLPKPAMNEGDTALYAAFAGSQLTDYARAAVEADRKQRWLKERAQLDQEWADLEDLQAQYETDRQRKSELVPRGWKLVPETPTSKQIVHMALQIKGADPDGWFRTDGDDWSEHVDAAERAYKWALSEAPQPAESCGSLISNKTACGSENGDCDSQPAEPVDISAFDELIDLYQDAQRNGTFEERTKVRTALKEAYRKALAQSAEPVKVLSEADILDLWTGDPTHSRPVMGKNKVIAFARALLARYGKGAP